MVPVLCMRKKGVINLTYKAIVSFTRIAANVHIECPTNVENSTLTRERETICDLKEGEKNKNISHSSSSAQSVPVSVGGCESGRYPFLRSQVSESHKVLNYKKEKKGGNIVHDKQAST